MFYFVTFITTEQAGIETLEDRVFTSGKTLVHLFVDYFACHQDYM